VYWTAQIYWLTHRALRQLAVGGVMFDLFYETDLSSTLSKNEGISG